VKLISIICFIIVPVAGANVSVSRNAGYIAGIVIAAIILGYLLYSLFKPEKF
jgi:K+-transporting ATPase KdpF subunit